MDAIAFRNPISISVANFVAILVVALAAFWFVNMQSSILTEPDEGRYAEIPREMLASGDWVTPRLDGIAYFEKPPLQYWITAATYRTFGQSAWASKLWTWTASFLGVLVVLFAGTRLFGARAGIIAALVLASSPLYFFVGHINTLDAGLTFFMTAALAAFLLSKNPGALSKDAAEGAKLARRWVLLAWVSTALAVLSKGPIGVVIPVIAMLAYAGLERSALVFRGLSPLRGMILMISIAAPWFVLVSMRNPGFVNFFFVHEHLTRFATTQHGRVHPWWYFAAILLAGILPWFLPSVRAWREGFSEQTAGQFAARKFLSIYALTVVVFFSASGSKLAPYIDPAIPALALLAGSWIDRYSGITKKTLLWGVGFSALLLLVAIPILRWQMHGASEEAVSAEFGTWMLAAGMVWLLGVVFAHHFIKRPHAIAMVLGIALPLLAGSQLLLRGLNSFAPTRGGDLVAEALQRDGAASRPVYAIDRYLQTVPFHLQKTVIVVGYPGELEVALDPHTPNWLPGLQEFADHWRRDDRPIAIVDRDRWPDVQRLGLRMRPFFIDSRVILVDKG